MILAWSKGFITAVLNVIWLPMKKKTLMMLTIFSGFYVHAMVIATRDTIETTLIGGALVSYQEPSGSKADESALVRISTHHAFSGNLYAECSIKGSRSFFTPFIEQGFIALHKKDFTATGGILTNRYGDCRLYKSTIVYNPLFEKWLLWDAYGFGISLENKINKSSIGGAVTLNNRENGSMHIIYTLQLECFQGILLGGFKSYSIENQDNCITLGTDIFLSRKLFQLHAVVKYDRYTGYGHVLNPSMKPGDFMAGFTEVKVIPSPSLEIALLTYFKSIKKSIDQKSFFEGFVLEFIPRKWLGIGSGMEFLINNSVLTVTPEIFITLKPIQKHASFAVCFKTSKTNNSSRVYLWSGNVWINF